MRRFQRFFIFACILFFAIFSGPLLAHAEQKHHGKHHKHGMGSRPVEEYIRMFESSDRASWQMPEKVVVSMGIQAGDAVADIGAGSGYFSVRFSEKTGEAGSVYAVDVESKMVDYINARIKKAGIRNITTILCEPDNPGLAPDSADIVFISNTYHHIFNRDAYLQRVAEALKSNGRLVIVDFKKEPTPEGPPQKMRISREDVVREITSAGYSLETEHFFLPYQYYLIFRLSLKE